MLGILVLEVDGVVEAAGVVAGVPGRQAVTVHALLWELTQRSRQRHSVAQCCNMTTVTRWSKGTECYS